jgi:hypothetical protein
MHHRIKDRLLALSPRAFELFAGDLLEYIGLRNVAVTRYVGDGGIDASGELAIAGALATLPTGVQVKRKRSNVGRPEIDQFIGALNNRYAHGIFITTAGFAPQAVLKAETSIPRVAMLNGERLTALMLRYRLGVDAAAAALDEAYFSQYEAQAGAGALRLGEQREEYAAAGAPAHLARPEDDLISMRALSHALRVDTSVVRRWVEQGRLLPDHSGDPAGFFFRRDRVEAIRAALIGKAAPAHPDEWRREFLDFARSRNMSKSYKPVLLKALLQTVDRTGEAAIADVVTAFRAFYVARRAAGQIVEFGPPDISDANAVSDVELRRLIVKNPLERFLIKGFLAYDARAGIVRFAPHLWNELRYWELLDVQQSIAEQLAYYYARPYSGEQNA